MVLTISYHLQYSVDLAHHKNFRAVVGNGGITSNMTQQMEIVGGLNLKA